MPLIRRESVLFTNHPSSFLPYIAGTSLNETWEIWYPIDELRPADSDITMFFLSQNTMTYLEPVQDPWFSASWISGLIESDNLVTSGTGINMYRSDFNVSALGCADQVRVCNPASGNCTEYGGVNQASNRLAGLGLNSVQLATAMSLLEADWPTASMVFGMGSTGICTPSLASQNAN
jgi:hypothetical protein